MIFTSEFISKDIDTLTKFEANRLRMAQNVWRMMAETNSATCKSCHSYTAMDHAKQSPAAAAAMTGAAAKNMNCISVIKVLRTSCRISIMISKRRLNS